MKLRETFGSWKLRVRYRLEVVRHDCGDLLRRDRHKARLRYGRYDQSTAKVTNTVSSLHMLMVVLFDGENISLVRLSAYVSEVYLDLSNSGELAQMRIEFDVA
jgi:hypothetical protein